MKNRLAIYLWASLLLVSLTISSVFSQSIQDHCNGAETFPSHGGWMELNLPQELSPSNLEADSIRPIPGCIERNSSVLGVGQNAMLRDGWLRFEVPSGFTEMIIQYDNRSSASEFDNNIALVVYEDCQSLALACANHVQSGIESLSIPVKPESNYLLRIVVIQESLTQPDFIIGKLRLTPAKPLNLGPELVVDGDFEGWGIVNLAPNQPSEVIAQYATFATDYVYVGDRGADGSYPPRTPENQNNLDARKGEMNPEGLYAVVKTSSGLRTSNFSCYGAGYPGYGGSSSYSPTPKGGYCEEGAQEENSEACQGFGSIESGNPLPVPTDDQANFMMINGRFNPSQTLPPSKVWCQTIPVEPGAYYLLSAALNNLVSAGRDQALSQIQFTVCAMETLPGTTRTSSEGTVHEPPPPRFYDRFLNDFIPDYGALTACGEADVHLEVLESDIFIPESPDSWRRMRGVYRVPEGVTAINFCIVNVSQRKNGNDLALDQISVKKIEMPYEAFLDNITCELNTPQAPEPEYSLVTGQIYLDNNQNCNKENEEEALTFEVEVAPLGIKVQPNELGNYSLALPLGTYTFKVSPPQLSSGVYELHCPEKSWEYTIEVQEAGKVLAGYDFNPHFTTFPNKIQGKVFSDQNRNCLQNTDEVNLSGWQVEVNPGAHKTLTDAQGYFSVEVPDSGAYSVQVFPPSEDNTYQFFCPADSSGYTINFNTYGESSDTLMFAYGAIPNQIRGKVYNDLNSNGIYDPDEPGLPNWVLRISPGGQHAISDREGNYAFTDLDTGSYHITQITPSFYQPFWSGGTPEEGYQLDLNTYGTDTSGFDFANLIKACSLLKVDVSSSGRRRFCFKGSTTVSYANEGQIPAEDVYVEVKFPEHIIPLSSDMAWERKNQSTYIFRLGTLLPGVSGRIRMIDSVACLNRPFGITQCVEAVIRPKQICQEPNPLWSGASLQITARCVAEPNSEVWFALVNNGSADMQEARAYRIFAGDTLILENQIQLRQQDSLVLRIPYQGSLLRMEVDQVPYHPDQDNILSAEVYQCGESISTVASAFSANDNNFDRELDCRPLVGSYDPNDKLVSPFGVTENHYVQPGTTLEYVVRFQNTGTAEAINIEILDTLSEHLEMSSFQMMSASHDYALDILGDSLNPVLRWRFEDINLPDSTSNEPESHGYVKFKIAPKAETPEGAIVENFADIYFDFNEPIRTNTTISNFTDYQFPQNPIDPCRLVSQAEAGGDQSLCESQNTAQIQATLPQSGQGQWQIIQGQGQLENPFSAQTNITNLTPGENILRWSVSTDLCAENYQEITLTLHPQPQRPIIQALAGNQLQASVPGDAYEWYFQGSLMSENSQTIEPNQEGDYQVKVIQNDCPSELSEVFSFVVASTEIWAIGAGFKLYPNPSTEAVQVAFERMPSEKLHIQIFNHQGKLIWAEVYRTHLNAPFQKSLPTERWEKGLYLLRLETEQGSLIRSFILE